MQNPCDLNGMHNSVKEALETCPGFDFNDNLGAVIFKGNLTFQDQACDFGGGASFGTPGFFSIFDPTYKWVYIRGIGGGLILAHELGHLLGLPDNSCNEPHTLMCSTDPQPEIGNCGNANTVARNRQNAYW